MNKIVASLACAMLSAVSIPANAATVVLTSNPKVASSITGVLLGNTSFNVTFDGTATSYVPSGLTSAATNENYKSAMTQIMQALNASSATSITTGSEEINQFAIRSGDATTATTLTAYSTQGNWQDYGKLYYRRPNIRFTAAVPEPATWAMMLVGFGMVAGAARHRRRSVKVSLA